ncbi:MAG TPA: flagellar protein FlaG [Nitrospirales bacterium]|nr:flagellar protein FlaG [Nitrospirales bacterium]
MITNVNGDKGIFLPPPLPEKARSSGEDNSAAPPAPRVETQGPSITLRVDDHTHEVIAVIRDRETDKVIGEIPPEEMRTAAKVIRALLGQLVDKLA